MFARELLRLIFRPRRYSTSAISANLQFIESELALYDAFLHSALRQLSDLRVLVLDLRRRLTSADGQVTNVTGPVEQVPRVVWVMPADYPEVER